MADLVKKPWYHWDGWETKAPTLVLIGGLLWTVIQAGLDYVEDIPPVGGIVFDSHLSDTCSATGPDADIASPSPSSDAGEPDAGTVVPAAGVARRTIAC